MACFFKRPVSTIYIKKNRQVSHIKNKYYKH